MTLRLGFLASNNGSSMRAIVGAIETGTLDAEARLVVSNKAASPALTFARDHNVRALHIATLPDPDAADAALLTALTDANVEWIVLSGYLRKLGPKSLAAFDRRILNVHPALLPSYGGHGFYGRRVHEAVAAAREAESGVTIHLVDEVYDHGPIVAQRRVPLSPGDDADAIERKVVAAEAPFFVETLQKLANGELQIASR